LPSLYPDIPARWQPAFERYRERLEACLAVSSAWLLLAMIHLHEASHAYLHVHTVDLGYLEWAVRAPLLFAALLTLANWRWQIPPWPARYFLRLMGLGLSGLALSMVFMFARYDPGTLNQIPDTLTIAIFGATVLGLRSFKEWLLIVVLPIAIFVVAVCWAGLASITLATVFIAPALMMLVTCVFMTIIRRLVLEGFLAGKELQELATTDTLTGLMNRRAFTPLMQQEHARAQRTGEPFSVVLGDLDRFKLVNDTWGHELGDEVLRETATRLRQSLRQQDVLCRWGGEEFLILLPGTSAQGAFTVAEKCRTHLEGQPMLLNGQPHTQTISLGVACFDGTESVTLLVGRADAALYQAKAKGRNRTELAASH